MLARFDPTTAAADLDTALLAAARSAVQSALDAADLLVANTVAEIGAGSVDLDLPPGWADDPAIIRLVSIGVADRIGLDPALWVQRARQTLTLRTPDAPTPWTSVAAARWADIAAVLAVSTQAAAQRSWWRIRPTLARSAHEVPADQRHPTALYARAKPTEALALKGALAAALARRRRRA